MRRAVLVVMLLAAGVVGVPSAAASVAATVEVRDNYFDPVELRIATGDSVAWRAVDGGHTIRSTQEQDGTPLFEFPRGSGQLVSGDTGSHTFATAGKFPYYCEIHPGSMRGTVYVDYEVPPDVRVPEDHSTIAAALAASEGGQVVSVAPGTYVERLVVRRSDVTIRGRGSDPGAVVIDGRGVDDTGVAILAAGVAIENLTVRRPAGDAVLIRQADRFVVRDVIADAPGRSGVRVLKSRGGALSGVQVTGAGGAGVVVEDCHTCGIAISGATVTASDAGIRLVNVGHVQLDDSVVTATRSGIELVSSASEPSSFARGAVIRRTTVHASDAGIAVRGGWDVRIIDNWIEGATAVDIGGVPLPAAGLEVRGNAVAGAHLDLRWDLIGTACFSDNVRPDGGRVSSSPPEIQRLFPCGGAGQPIDPM